uniref:Lysoplasmalogenase n=2 Tax=Vibrio ziniensis TaxID=2711221 RepID=A0A6G7CLQ1_9VIBR|nr:lysoplasmalogenase [Vibrio ziniensis]
MLGWISALISGFVSISAFENNKTKLAIVFNTLCLGLLSFMVINQQNDGSVASLWVLAGLVVSAIADIYRIQQKQAKACFSAFLVVQLFYSKAFWIQLTGPMIWWLPALLIAASIVAFFLLLPQIDTLIFPVTVMGMMLLQMTGASGEVWITNPTPSSLLGFIGSLSFIVSAIILAIHDYRQPLRYGNALISGCYLLAQGLIVASVVI